MKFLKYSVLILTLAIVTDFALASAYSSPAMVDVSPTLSATGVYTSNTFTKNTGQSVRQAYEHFSSITALTNPCPNCQIGTRIRAYIINPLSGEITEEYPEGIKTRMGDVSYFNDIVNYEGDNLVYVWRHDFTTLKTYHSALWYLNMNYTG